MTLYPYAGCALALCPIHTRPAILCAEADTRGGAIYLYIKFRTPRARRAHFNNAINYVSYFSHFRTESAFFTYINRTIFSAHTLNVWTNSVETCDDYMYDLLRLKQLKTKKYT